MFCKGTVYTILTLIFDIQVYTHTLVNEDKKEILIHDFKYDSEIKIPQKFYITRNKEQINGQLEFSKLNSC